MAEIFDYIISGGGSAGCALAARLAEDSRLSVCLIEAGGRGRDVFIRMPAGNGFVFGHPRLDWGYRSAPQPGLNGRRIDVPRGKALGGTSIVNGMIYMRGIPYDYDNWRQMGLEGWGYADLLPYFKRAEGAQNRQDAFHGRAGPLKTEPAVNFGVLDKAFVDAAVAAGHPVVDDFNGVHRTGVGRCDSTVSHGIRQSAAIAYLSPPPRNLKIMTKTQAGRIILDGRRARAIETTDGRHIHARQEIIICQGAIGTPHMLMLSGIGPAGHLHSMGITPLVDLPGVGAGLADHLNVAIQYGSDHAALSHARHQRLDRAVLLMGQWLLARRGPGSGSLFSVVLFHALDDPSRPEFEVFMTPMIVEESISAGGDEAVPYLHRLGRRLLVRGHKAARPGVQIDINQERPRSTGTIRLASPYGHDKPIIDPNYLDDPTDMEEMIQGVKAIQKIMTRNEIARYITGALGAWDGAESDNDIAAAIRQTAYTGHHLACSARMGGADDRLAVLDAHLRVRGVEGLRVCDAAAMPSQITGNLYATVVAMAEKAADLIRGRPALTPEYPPSLIPPAGIGAEATKTRTVS